MLQNMKGSQLLAVTAIAGLALMGSTFKAQNAPTKVGIVDVDAVLASHPKYKDLTDLNEKAVKEMDQLRTSLKINDLATKAQAASASAKDKQDFDTAKKTLDNAAKKWQTQIDAVLNPVNDDIDRALGEVAKAQGFSLLLNRKVASQSQLVVYANEQVTNLTSDVMKALK